MEELRLYFLILRNLGAIDKGIQAGHCAVEYGQKYKNDPSFITFATKFKTFILLEGGTSNNGWSQNEQNTFIYDELSLGTMEIFEKYLIENKLNFAAFREPDANNALTALCFLCDERVFNFDEYPTFKKWVESQDEITIDSNLEMDFDEIDNPPPYKNKNLNELYKKWTAFVGGEKNAALKQLIYGKKLA